MRLDRLSLQPKQNYDLNEPLKIYLDKKVTSDDLDTMLKAFSKRKTPLVISGKQSKDKAKFGQWTFQIEMASFTLHIGPGINGKSNFSSLKFISNSGATKSYHNRFAKMFFLDAKAGYYLIFKGSTYCITPDGSYSLLSQSDNPAWDMTDEVYDELYDRMCRYFGDKDEDFERSQRMSDKARANVMDPFDWYTEKEHEYETQKVDFTQGTRYQDWIVGSVSRGKKSYFTLVSNDPSADPEVCKLTAGQLVAIYSEDQQYSGLNGLLVDIDAAGDEGVLFSLEFYQQFDAKQLPKSGYLFVHQNDTQYKIRKNVAKSINRGKTPAKYMYRTFRDYSVEGYEDLEDHPGLVEFLHKRMGQQFPPNQMQLEAIVKGILTEDLLLVLGPPGTGKTTVILSWVEYFLSRGKRVLVSSQNNAAVDNVLERLGEDKNREIVRLGREEKVQENCKQFIPFNRVKSMRESCEKNNTRLKQQLSSELQQVVLYRNALKEMSLLLDQESELRTKLKQKISNLEQQCKLVSATNSDIIRLREEIADYRTQLQSYTIFMEESNAKGFITRLLQFAQRRKANKILYTLRSELRKKEPKLREKERQYARACEAMDSQAKVIRGEMLLQKHSLLHKNIAQLQQSILGTTDAPSLIPSFESELHTLDCLADFNHPNKSDLQKKSFLSKHIALMDQVEVSAHKILEASNIWSKAALSGDRNEIFEDILLEACQVVGATCIGINSNKRFSTVDFDVTIIDESGQIQLHNALVPMSRSPKTLMLGDYKQIPPIVNEDIVKTCEKEGISTNLYDKSFFEHLFEEMREKEINWLCSNPRRLFGDTPLPEDPEEATRLSKDLARAEILKPQVPDYIGTPLKRVFINDKGEQENAYSSRYNRDDVQELILDIVKDRKKIVNLNSQFRMPGNISDVISEWFYESNYFSSYDMSRFKAVVPGTSLPMVVVDTSSLRNRFESQPSSKMGYQNLAEAEIVADILEAILKNLSPTKRSEYIEHLDKRLGVISAYGAQVRYIRQTLCKRLHITNAEASTAVASLDSFQGQERDLIIYSLTRSDKKNPNLARVGFLKELRRLNVAFTRCKKQLVIIGDLDYLQSCLYVPKETDHSTLPCTDTADDTITKLHIYQCAECKVDCERRFSRFFRLLMQHVRAENPAGDLIPAHKLNDVLEGRAVR